MNSFVVLFQMIAKPLFFLLLGISALAGVIAIVSPRLFERTVALTSRTIDTKKILAVLDKPVDIDRYTLAHSRLLGVVVIAAVATLIYVYRNH